MTQVRVHRREFLKRTGLTAVGALSGGLLLDACSGSAEDESPSGARNAGGEIDQIIFAMAVAPELLFVPRAWTTGTGTIVSLAQEGLLTFDNDLQLAPSLAESWEIADPTTYVYHLREGVMFHDGSPLTAEDIVFSMLLQVDPDAGSQLGQFYRSVNSIEATDDMTVTVKLDHPDSQFQYTPAILAGLVLPKSFYEQHPEDIGTPDALLPGTGPFEMVEFVPGESVTLERFDDYWGSKPAAKKIVMRFIPDQQTRLLALQSGDVDAEFDIDPALLDQYSNLPGMRVQTTPSLGIVIFTMNVNVAPWDDIHVRRAVAYSIDREGLVQASLQGKGAPLVTINPVEMWSGVLSADEVAEFEGSLPNFEFDLERARDELAQSAHPDGFDWTLHVPSFPPMLQASQSLAQSLNEIGIRVKLQQDPDADFYSRLFGHEDLGLEVQGYSPDFADPVAYPWLFLHSANSHRDGNNTSEYRNATVDGGLDQALESTDPAERGESIKSALTQAADDVPLVPVHTRDVAMALREDFELEGFTAFWYQVPWGNRGLTRAG